jgi:hypothetical protein
MSQYPNALPTRAAVAGYVEDYVVGYTLGGADAVAIEDAGYTANTVEQNTLDRPIFITFDAASNTYLYVSSDNVTFVKTQLVNQYGSASMVIPAGWYFYFDKGVTQSLEIR